MILLKEREGMQIFQEGDQLVKIASDDANLEGLKNSWRFLKALEYSGYAPQPISFDGQQLRMEFIKSDPLEQVDSEAVRRNMIKMLWAFKNKSIIHGDLTHVNFIIRNNVPIAIDWDQAIFAWEPKPQKRPQLDQLLICKALAGMNLDPSRVLRRWMLCYPVLKDYFGWGTFLDVGTHMGDFVGLAAMSGMRTIGIDTERIRPCIEPARNLWGYMSAVFYKEDIVESTYLDTFCNIKMLFSTWPYIVQDHGMGMAVMVLEHCIKTSDVFLFETQLYGDGPGPEALHSMGDVMDMLHEYGAHEIDNLGTIPVGGRTAERTVLAVRG